MPNSHVNWVIEHLRRVALPPDGSTLTDGQLLQHFIADRDEAAFAALLCRHGPMVLGVCRRVLAHAHDAEDAFQATFLVLVRKAPSVVPREAIGNWLYGVAHTTALRAKVAAAKRRRREKQVQVMPEPEPPPENRWEELQPVLDRELSRLPDKYRLPVVLCDLEGRRRRDVAGQLQIPEGTLSSRLTTARRLLAKRLARHGLALSGGALATALSHGAASAGVPTSLVSSTIKAANLNVAGQTAAAGVSVKVAALTEGVLKAMLLTRLKAMVVGVLVVAVLGLGGGGLVWQSQAAEEAAQQASTAAPSGDKDDDLKKTLLKLDELWWKGDPETLRRLAADDLISVSPVGRYDKPAMLAAAEHRRAVEGRRRDVEVRRISKDVAVLTYVYDCKVVLRDGTLFQNCRNRRSSMIWAKRKGDWVVVFAQETYLPGGE
jgi:RNA polymerase sigma factor (sigma-70 family)